ncbi:MAG: insulinase family protein [Oscillospiraceae bacterium]|jgi:predicted Zn-dependent peptidase|nr:insulinase family protein [Oscillospiraceae bacterium]
MQLMEIKSNRLNDSYFYGKHNSGLKVYVYPKKDNSSTYAIFGTKFGSINTKFKDAKTGETLTVPDGIAHFLEHKLFESEDGDAFKKYAKTGASANAYTSFDITGYLFSCTKNFEESLKILLNFVQTPYFTEKSIEKEQGIIGQEIRMYDDSPNWRVLVNLLSALYQKHPIRVDVAGTVESIAKITPKNLYDCYENFYNLNNMTLCIAGNIEKEKVIEILEGTIKTTPPVEPESIFPEEPYEILKDRVEQNFDISVPMFQLGFKEKAEKTRPSLHKIVETEILLEIFASKASHLYRELLDKSLINSSFGSEYFEGPAYASVIFSGESQCADKVAEIIRKAADELHQNGIAEEDFKRAKKAVWARYVCTLNSVSSISKTILGLSFANWDFFTALDLIAESKLEDVENRLKEQLDSKNSALSVVSPLASCE